MGERYLAGGGQRAAADDGDCTAGVVRGAERASSDDVLHVERIIDV